MLCICFIPIISLKVDTHFSLTTAQSDRLEVLQKRALCIILYPMTLPYNTPPAYCEIESLKL